MSLIQEALRRRGEETGVPLTLRPPADAVPPPLPPPAPPSKPVWPWLLVGLGLIVVVGFSAAWWFRRQPSLSQVVAKVTQKPVQSPVAKPSVPPPPPVVVVAPKVAPTNAPATNNILAKVKATLEKTITPERRELILNVTNPPVVIVPLQPTLITTSPPVAHVSVPPPPAPQPPKPIHWPKLAVTGVMARNGDHGMAFINGQLVGAGDDLQEVHILQVTGEGVRLMYQGETNFLRVGHSTE